MGFEWFKKFSIGKRNVNDDYRSLAQLENLLPGAYYRLKVAPEVSLTHIGEDIHELLGYDAKELHNETTMATLRQLHPEYQAILETKKSLCTQSREAKKLEYHLYTKAGTLKLVHDHFIGEYNRTGRLVAINGYFKEVKRSGVKRQLVNQLEAYRTAIDVNIISSITDLHGNIIYANDNFKKISQYTEDELLGKNHRMVRSDYHPKSFFENLWKTISAGQMWRGEIQNRAKDGSLYWVDTVIIPVIDDNHKIRHYLSLRVLVTDRKRAEELRQKYVTVLEDIAHSVAHDLRGPVSTILGLANVVKVSGCNDPGMEPVRDYIVNAANRLDEITREFSSKIHSLDAEMRAKEIKSTLEFFQKGHLDVNQNGQKGSILNDSNLK